MLPTPIPYNGNDIGHECFQIAQIMIYDKAGQSRGCISIDWHRDQDIPVFGGFANDYFLLPNMGDATFKEVLGIFGYSNYTPNENAPDLNQTIKGHHQLQFDLISQI